MAVKVGFVTIGQSPREDIVPEIMSALRPHVERLERGALDGLCQEEIKRLRPGKGDFRLITRLRDGRAVVVGKKKIVPLLKKRINELAEQDVRLIGLLCTNRFPGIAPRGGRCEIVLQPWSLIFRETVARLKKGKLGVFVPLKEQMGETKRKWQKTGLRVVVEAHNPYQGSPGYDRAIERMKAQAVDLVVLDCIGYMLIMKENVQHILGTPVLLPRAVLADEINKWLSLSAWQRNTAGGNKERCDGTKTGYRNR